MGDPNLVYFAKAQGDEVATKFEVLLNNHGIPCVKKYQELGGVYHLYAGSTKQTIEIYLSPSDVEKASELVAKERAIKLPKNYHSIYKDQDVKEMVSAWQKRQNLWLNLRLGFLALGMIAIVLGMLFGQ